MTSAKETMKPSDESTREQLRLGRGQGDALSAAVHEMTDHEAHGREKVAGDYLVGFAVENAEGLYLLRDGALQWTEPTDENAHVEISIRDAADGRFVPGVVVHATILDESGSEIGTHRQPFLWHPWLFHYGRNWRLPGDGSYTIRVHIDVPDFPRHDKLNGRRYAKPVDVEFKDVHIKTGQKCS